MPTPDIHTDFVDTIPWFLDWDEQQKQSQLDNYNDKMREFSVTLNQGIDNYFKKLNWSFDISKNTSLRLEPMSLDRILSWIFQEEIRKLGYQRIVWLDFDLALSPIQNWLTPDWKILLKFMKAHLAGMDYLVSSISKKYNIRGYIYEDPVSKRLYIRWLYVLAWRITEVLTK